MAAALDTTPAPVRFLIERFGGRFTEDDATISVGTSATQIVTANPETVALTLINLGAEDVYVRPSPAVSATAGILLLASGGSVSLNVRDDAMLPARSWWGLAASSTSDVYYLRTARYHVEA